MTELVSMTSGLYPLPDWAKQKPSDLKGHQKHDLISGDGGGNIVGAYNRTCEEAVSEQTDAGLDRIVEGQLCWDDMLAHPLAVHESVETDGIVHYYNNNNSYRDPQVSGELTFPDNAAAELDATADLLSGDEPLQAVFSDPYSPSDLTIDEHYDDKAESLGAVGKFLAGKVDAFPDHKTLFLLELSLVFPPPSEDVDERVSGAISAVSDTTNADVVVHACWGTLDGRVYAHLMDADMDTIDFDFVAGNRDQMLHNVNEHGTKDDIALGLVGSRNTLVEDPETIHERVEWTSNNAQNQMLDTTYVTSNTELFYPPENRATEKLAALTAVTGDELEVET